MTRRELHRKGTLLSCAGLHPLLMGLAVGLTACTGQLSEQGTDRGGGDGDGDEGDSPDGTDDTVGNPPRPDAPTPADLETLTAVAIDREKGCSPEQAPAPTLRRLSASELRNTLADLLAGYQLPAVTLPGDTAVHGFENIDLRSSPNMIENIDSAVASIARSVNMQGRQQLVGCDFSQDSCVKSFVTSFGRRAYRRPLSSTEIDTLVTFVETQRQALGEDAAFELALVALLNAPDFLWRFPAGTADMPRAYGIANALSYFLWQSMPDDVLFDAAEAGELDTPAQIEGQIERMLADPRAARAFGEFHRQWLGLATLFADRGSKNPDRFPLWKGELSSGGIQQETIDFAGMVFASELPSFYQLLNDRHAKVNADSAPFLGVDPTLAGEIIELPVEERGGILTRPGFTTVGARENSGSPPLRGVAIMERFLCIAPVPPPADVNTNVVPDEGAMPRSNREVFEEKTRAPACLGCHAQIDGFGMLFEAYDGVGRYRAEDGGMPVDASTTLVGVTPGDFATEEVQDALEFSKMAADSVQARYCYAANWYRYALGREEHANEWCRLDAIYDEFAKTGGNLKALIKALALLPELGGAL